MTKSRESSNGFTLIELLIAGTLFVLILTVLTGFLISSNKVYTNSAQQIEEEQLVSVAEQVLSYELSLAGYRGTDTTLLAGRLFDSTNKSFEVASGQTSDTLTIRYFEDRFTEGADVAKTAIYFAAVDAQNQPYLYRQENGGAAEAIVEDVTSLNVIAYLLADGALSSSLPAAQDLAGLKLELSFSHGYDHTMLVNFSGPQAY